MPDIVADKPNTVLVSPGSCVNTLRMRVSFVLSELSGSMGDLGTFLPLALAISATGTLDFGCILICAGLMNVLAGWSFRQPIPAQPMKALAAIAITEQLTRGQIAAAGLMIAVALLVLSLSGAINWASRLVPKPVVRGIQLGIGLRLIFKGLEWLFGIKWAGLHISIGEAMPVFGLDSLIVAGLAGILLCAPWFRRMPLLVPIFTAGFVLAGVAHPGIYRPFEMDVPVFSLQWPTVNEWQSGMLEAGLPQLSLTLLNSVIAICALSSDRFGKAGITPRRMSLQIGLVNLLVVPFGALPMCHGAGGLAAQYRFGGRSGLSSILLGGMMLAAGIVLGKSAIHILSAYPLSLLAVMLILAGWSLAQVVRDSLTGNDLMILLATVTPILLFNTAIGFLVGLSVAAGVWLVRRRRV